MKGGGERGVGKRREERGRGGCNKMRDLTQGQNSYTYLTQHLPVQVSPWCLSVLHYQQASGGPWDGVLTIEVSSEAVPVLEADLEDLLLLHMGYLDQVHQTLHSRRGGQRVMGV